jgi:Spy/CpxP family protein refolding chaperone
MKTIKFTALSAAIAATLTLTTASVMAQADNTNGGNRRGGTPEEFLKRMNDRLKTSLKATDEEWTIIQPLLEKVTTKQREAAGSRFGGMRGGPGGPGGGRGGNNGGNNGGGDQGPRSAGSLASESLRTALENDAVTPAEIKAKLAAVREARKKAAAELAAAREELSKVLSVRQEAALVSNGILE